MVKFLIGFVSFWIGTLFGFTLMCIITAGKDN